MRLNLFDSVGENVYRLALGRFKHAPDFARDAAPDE